MAALGDRFTKMISPEQYVHQLGLQPYVPSLQLYVPSEQPYMPSLQPFVSQVRLPAREVRQQPARTAADEPAGARPTAGTGAAAAGTASGAGTGAAAGAAAVRVGGGCSAYGELLGPSHSP